MIQPAKPELALNRGGETVAGTLRGFLAYAGDNLKGQVHLAVATAYFNVEGFVELREELEKIDEVRLLLGVEPDPPTPRPRKLPQVYSLKDNNQAAQKSSEEEVSEGNLRDHYNNLRWDLDLADFSFEMDEDVRQLLEWLKKDSVQVRRLENKFLHAKAFLLSHHTDNGTDLGVIAGSSNFTKAGLTRNAELNLGNYNFTVVEQIQDFFAELWEQAADYDLAAIFESALNPHAPYLIYLRMLWQIYRAELLDEPTEVALTLAKFQQLGVHRAKKIIDKYGGVLIADEVGLGKTHIAAKLIHETSEKAQGVLIMAPAALKAGMWEGFIRNRQFRRGLVELVSFDEMVKQRDTKSGEIYQKCEAGNFAMVVVDEAHHLRNPDTKRAKMLHWVMKHSPILVLLTATPVNNKLWDLYNLLHFFLPTDTALSKAGVNSLTQVFANALQDDPENLSEKGLFAVNEAVTVRRMRSFIKGNYPNDTFKDENGNSVEIKFPAPNVCAVNYELDDVMPSGFFDRFDKALSGDYFGKTTSEIPPGVLTFARYMPSKYLKVPNKNQGEVNLAGLMRSLLLKRFESSPHAFANSCQQMIESNNEFLQLLNTGKVLERRLVEESSTDSDDMAIGSDDKSGQQTLWEEVDSEGYDTDNLHKAVKHDTELLKQFRQEALTVTLDADPTLKELRRTLIEIVNKAEEEGLGAEDKKDKRKVLIFSYYADTVEWIYDYLIKESTKSDSQLGVYKGAIEKIVGADSKKAKSDVLLNFAPKTAGAGVASNAGTRAEIDIVVATDVLAEGVNLQQARNIINYDLPWNPMRLVQRHGRIDRLGSNHTEVFLYCVMPSKSLEKLLKLERKLRWKLNQAKVAMGVGEILPDQERFESNFTETQEEIKKIQAGDTEFLEQQGGREAALTGEHLRHELREALKNAETKKQIEGLPWKSGSIFASDLGAGWADVATGVVFCVQVGDSEQGDEQKDKAANCLFCFVDTSSGSVVVREAGLLDCLFLAKPPDGWETKAVDVSALELDSKYKIYEAWEVAREHMLQNWTFETDKKNISPDVPSHLHKAGDILRNFPPKDLDQESLNKAVESVEAPLSKWQSNAIRKIVNGREGSMELSRDILAEIEELGLRPYKSPQPNPRINESYIYPVCWQAIINTGYKATREGDV